MCGACWTHRVDEEPWCASCVAVLEQPVSWLAYAAGAVLAIGLSWIGLARLPSPARWIALGIGVSIVSLTAWRLRRRAASRRAGFVAQVRAPDSEPPRGPPMGYRRGRAPLRARRLAPPVSGSLTALIVGSTMALTAFAFPSLLQLQRWLELELVIALWWGVWTLTFVILLYRGWRVARDLAPTGAIRAPARVAPGSRSGSSRWTWADVFAGALDLDGCLVVLAVAAAFGVAFVIAELILPMLLTGAYWLIVRGLTSVANDDHGCERSWPRALAWGALWSTAYTAPLAALVWLGHWLLRA